MKIVPHHIIDSDDIPNQTTNIIPLTTPPIQPSFPTSSPVQANPTHEDNAATIAQVINDRLTPRVKHVDILIGWLNEQSSCELMKPVATPSNQQKGCMNTKPHGGFTLQTKFLEMVGHQFYPPPFYDHR